MLAVWSVKLDAQEWKQYPYTPEGSLISFPADEGWHPAEEVEWWYIAGYLEGTASSTPYSFMLSYFYYPSTYLTYEFDGFRILNISNDQTGVFHTHTMILNYQDLATDQLHIDARLFDDIQEHWYHKEETDGTLIPFEYELWASSGQDTLELSTVSQKAPLIPGGDGLFDQGAQSYTYYYSLTESSVEGSLTFEGTSEEVSGSAWIDRQYGTFNPNTGEQYEWFYLKLSNGMDLNIWNIFTSDNQQPDHPSYRHLSVYVDEQNQYTTYDLQLERSAWAKMPLTENCYAQEWHLTSDRDQLDLTFYTLFHNSEVELPFYFFEGAISATGTVNGSAVNGKGFAELLKRYEEPQIQLVSPEKSWNENIPIRWEVGNPDDGRPLLFDLFYSTTGEEPWNPIDSEISDSLFYWNDPPFVNGDTCRFRIEGYTADLTLQGSAISADAIHYDDQYTYVQTNRVPEISTRLSGDRLWIECKDEKQESALRQSRYRIMDLSGRILLRGELNGASIDVGRLRNGIYIFTLLLPGGKSSQKFIRQ